MGRHRATDKHLPRNIYRRRGRYQLRHKDGSARNYGNLDDALKAWAVEYGEVQGDTFHDVMLAYRANVLPEKAPRTQKDYQQSLERLDGVFGKMRVSSIRPTHIYKFQDLRASAGAKVHVNRDLAVMSVVMNHAVRMGHIDRNPCKEVRRRPEKPRDRYVTDAELAIVYGLANEWMKRAIRLACLTGIRLGDMCRIGPENITDEGFTFRQGKTGRVILITWDADGVLRDCAKRPPVAYWGFTSAWQRLMKKATKNGLQEPFRFHDLRAKAGSDARDWRILGHTSEAIFNRVYNRKPVKVEL